MSEESPLGFIAKPRAVRHEVLKITSESYVEVVKYLGADRVQLTVGLNPADTLTFGLNYTFLNLNAWNTTSVTVPEGGYIVRHEDLYGQTQVVSMTRSTLIRSLSGQKKQFTLSKEKSKMVVRFAKKNVSTGPQVSACRITEKNVAELVAYINKHNQTALNESKTFDMSAYDLPPHTAVKLSLVQRVLHRDGRNRRAVRKAYAGDYIVRTETGDKKRPFEFERIKKADFENLVK